MRACEVRVRVGGWVRRLVDCARLKRNKLFNIIEIHDDNTEFAQSGLHVLQRLCSYVLGVPMDTSHSHRSSGCRTRFQKMSSEKRRWTRCQDAD